LLVLRFGLRCDPLRLFVAREPARAALARPVFERLEAARLEELDRALPFLLGKVVLVWAI
jgi:hypothetical protein